MAKNLVAVPLAAHAQTLQVRHGTPPIFVNARSAPLATSIELSHAPAAPLVSSGVARAFRHIVIKFHIRHVIGRTLSNSATQQRETRGVGVTCRSMIMMPAKRELPNARILARPESQVGESRVT